jgi:hypothetical protein
MSKEGTEILVEGFIVIDETTSIACVGDELSNALVALCSGIKTAPAVVAAFKTAKNHADSRSGQDTPKDDPPGKAANWLAKKDADDLDFAQAKTILHALNDTLGYLVGAVLHALGGVENGENTPPSTRTNASAAPKVIREAVFAQADVRQVCLENPLTKKERDLVTRASQATPRWLRLFPNMANLSALETGMVMEMMKQYLGSSTGEIRINLAPWFTDPDTGAHYYADAVKFVQGLREKLGRLWYLAPVSLQPEALLLCGRPRPLPGPGGEEPPDGLPKLTNGMI